MRLACLMLAACLAATGVVARAADVLAPPQWSASQVRAARSTAPEPALVIDIERTLAPAPGGAPTVIDEKVTLANSFTLVGVGDAQTLYDHSLCRVFRWKTADNAFASQSCYAEVAARVFELHNREHTADVARQWGLRAPVALMTPYWNESELGVQNAPGDPLVRTAAGDGFDYKLGDQVVVKLRGAGATVSPDEMRAFLRYLAHRYRVHPQVRRDLLAARQLPTSIELSEYIGADLRVEQVVIRSVSRTPATYPLPQGLASSIRQAADRAASPRERGLAAVLRLAEDPAHTAKPTLEALVSDLTDAGAHGRSVDVMLIFAEMTQLYAPLISGGQGAALLQAKVGPEVRKALQDPAAASFWSASDLAASPTAPGDREAAARYLASTNLDDHPFGTFRYVTFANLVRSSGDAAQQWNADIRKSMPPLEDGVWLHISKYPWSSNAYKDLGDTYLMQTRTDDAWLAYDLGRSVDARWSQGPLGALGRFEDHLRAGFADFF